MHESGSSADEDGDGMQFNREDSTAGFGSSGFVIDRTASVTFN